MDRDVTPDQKVLLDASTRFIEQAYPLPAVRADLHQDPDIAAEYRRTAAELGWFSLLVPDTLGGGCLSGNGVLDAVLVAYLRGQRLQPGAFVSTNVVAYALGVAGSEEQQAKVLPALISGQQTATWILGDPDPHGPGITATGNGLTGSATFVIEGHTANWLLVTARGQEGVAQFLVPADSPGLTVTRLESLDVTRHFAEVSLDGVTADPVGMPGDAADLVNRQLALASVLTAAESVGAMDRDFAMAVQYSKDRIAFGRPIGSFQAVKHQLADTSLLLELCKATTLGAARSLGTEDDFGVAAASIAKALVGEHGVDLAQTCFQIFGGVGFTWEHDQHLYLRRLTTDAALFGDPNWHRERLCQLSGLTGGVRS